MTQEGAGESLLSFDDDGPFGRSVPDDTAAASMTFRQGPAGDKPCELYAHSGYPKPSRTQYHHTRPVYLQNRVYGQIRHPADKWLCGSCHDSVHDVIGWLLGETRKPNPMPGRNAITEAKRTVTWYLNAQEDARA